MWRLFWLHSIRERVTHQLAAASIRMQWKTGKDSGPSLLSDRRSATGREVIFLPTAWGSASYLSRSPLGEGYHAGLLADYGSEVQVHGHSPPSLLDGGDRGPHGEAARTAGSQKHAAWVGPATKASSAYSGERPGTHMVLLHCLGVILSELGYLLCPSLLPPLEGRASVCSPIFEHQPEHHIETPLNSSRNLSLTSESSFISFVVLIKQWGFCTPQKADTRWAQNAQLGGITRHAKFRCPNDPLQFSY